MPLPALFVLGDSISIQYGPALERAVRGAFTYSRKQGLDLAMKNLDAAQGANGGDSRMCVDYLTAARGTLHCDVLLVNCGLHDVKTTAPDVPLQVPIEAYETNLGRLFDVAASGLADHVVWVRTTPVDEARHNTGNMHRYQRDVDAYNAVADRVMSSRGVPSIDLHRFSLSLGSPSEIMHDGRHYHPPVRDQQGAYIGGWLTAWWPHRSAARAFSL